MRVQRSQKPFWNTKHANRGPISWSAIGSQAYNKGRACLDQVRRPLQVHGSAVNTRYLDESGRKTFPGRLSHGFVDVTPFSHWAFSPAAGGTRSFLCPNGRMKREFPSACVQAGIQSDIL